MWQATNAQRIVSDGAGDFSASGLANGEIYISVDTGNYVGRGPRVFVLPEGGGDLDVGHRG